jgi:hypothetical protein
MELRQTILNRIEAISNSERITKHELGEISRDMLVYLVMEDTNDIEMLNRLLSALTPMNLKTAHLFFKHFVPFKLPEGEMFFTTKQKGQRKLDKAKERSSAFLENEANNIWTWAEEHVKVDKKPVNYAKNITSNIERALSDEENGLDQYQVLEAVLAGGMTPDAILTVLSKMAEPV